MHIRNSDNIFTLIDKFNFRNNTLFKNLSDEEKKMLEVNIVTVKYEKSQVLFHEGGYPSGVYILRSGTVKKYKTSEDGREIIFYICRPDEILGYHAVLSEESYSDTARATEDSMVSFIPKEDFINVLNAFPNFSLRLLKNLSHEFGVLINGIMIHANKSVRERIALTLLVFYYKFKEGDNTYSVISLSRDDMANYIGTAKENLIRTLHEFKDKKIIKTDRNTITVIDVSKLISILHIHLNANP